MDGLEMINTRRSVRQFKETPVSDEDIKTILNAGFHAPSAINLRPYHFIVIKDKEIIKELSTYSRGKIVLGRAPLVIAVIGDQNIMSNYEFVMNDGSACIMNMLLAAHYLGLGACWCGQKRNDREDDEAKLLNLKEKMFVVGFIAIGHPDEQVKRVDRYDDSKVFINKM